MKKLFITFMALCLSFGAFGFVACKDKDDDTTPPANEQTGGDNTQNGGTTDEETDGDNTQNGDTTDDETDGDDTENGDTTDDETEDSQEPIITGRPGELPILPI